MFCSPFLLSKKVPKITPLKPPLLWKKLWKTRGRISHLFAIEPFRPFRSARICVEATVNKRVMRTA